MSGNIVSGKWYALNWKVNKKANKSDQSVVNKKADKTDQSVVIKKANKSDQSVGTT